MDINLRLPSGKHENETKEDEKVHKRPYDNQRGTNSNNPFDKSRNMALEASEVNILYAFFEKMQSLNSNFFYAIEVDKDKRVKNMLWVDSKSRHDYIDFCDVISFDTSYIQNKYRIPLALFVGVNQHYQFMLLGCALLSDETVSTYSWVMQTWVSAMGSRTPKVIITEKNECLESAVSQVFPSTKHCFCLWNIIGKINEGFKRDDFIANFEKNVSRSSTDEQFDKRWFKMAENLGFKDSDWSVSLYETRKQWAPVYMNDVFLAGMSTFRRSESVNCFFDRYVHRKTSVEEFVKQYECIIDHMYKEKARGVFETRNNPPTLKTPFPFEKQVSGIYTHAVFKMFQREVLGTVACLPKRETKGDFISYFKISECEKELCFSVCYNAETCEVSCSCRLFELKGYLCRHGLIVLRLYGFSAIPWRYIWTKYAKKRGIILILEGSELVH